jgi:endonuclease YncB( thermonuclease family)
VLAIGALAVPRADATAWTRVVLNGTVVPVSFNDGDTFRVHAGEFSGSSCRLGGFNTLESFGPAHQWGGWHPYELYTIAKMATYHGQRGTWHCTTDGSRDVYGRLLTDCPDLAVSQIEHGYAHAYEVDDAPTRPAYIRAQQRAIAERRGMWAHGVPDYVMTSIHSASEDPGRESHYNRLISLHDGHSESMRHHDSYSECEWVCNMETRADEQAVTRAALALRSELGPQVADWQNFHLLEFARRFARLGQVPEYLTGASRDPILQRLTQASERGELGTTHEARGSCMIYVEFQRRYGRDRASCVAGHGTLPPGVTVGGH